MRNVSVVIPCLNEEQSLPLVLKAMPECVQEVIIVDGESKDRTTEVAVECLPDVVIVRQHAPGKGAASVAGILRATNEIVVLMDGDGSMNPEDIDSMVTKLEAGTDIVHGSRNLPGGGSSDFTKIRSTGNDLLTFAVDRAYRVKWSDLTYGYVAMWRDVIETLELAAIVDGQSHPLYDASSGRRHRPIGYGHGFEIEVLMLCRAVRAGLTVEEVGCFEEKRRFGSSNLRAFHDGVRVARALVRERLRSTQRYADVMPRAQRRNARMSLMPPHDE